ncbi:HypC/HybG/HupF family hydrogenase formation chaperone [candidate division KSB1 bacterium]|nr:HypC/HybG/HupF family hydrogenase formation chaperone [candidate division KSB1 bacterium]
MCLAVPMKVIETDKNTARVEIGGTQRTIRLDIIDQQPQVGDYVIVHAGFAINVIDEKEAQITLQYFEDMLANESETSQ